MALANLFPELSTAAKAPTFTAVSPPRETLVDTLAERAIAETSPIAMLNAAIDRDIARRSGSAEAMQAPATPGDASSPIAMLNAAIDREIARRSGQS
jgi:hypothetical protein